MKNRIFLIILVIGGLFQMANAQTRAISYQGKLDDGGLPANGLYHFSFKFFPGPTGGGQIGPEIFLWNNQVTNGIFNVFIELPPSFSSFGDDRFLEISVRTGSTIGAYTTLSPRVKMASVPSALNAGALGNIPAFRFVRDDGAGRVGIGTTTPTFKLHIVDSGNTGLRVQTDAGGGTVASFGGFGAFLVDGTSISGGRFYITEDGKVGIGLSFNQSPDKLAVNGTVSLLAASGGSTQLCLNNGNQISTCSSSLRYKTNIAPFNFGLNLVKRLQPITFNWKADNKADFGFGAEEVANIEPLLVTYNDKGEVEGVKYDRVGVVLVNAVNEQQIQIEEIEKQNQSQQKQIDEQKEIIKRQQAELDALKALVCSQNPAAEVCKPKN